MFRQFGPMEIRLILLIILIVFGVGKLPQVGGAIGKGIHEFRKSSHGDESGDKPSDPKSEANPKTETDEKPAKS
jgi:sec-independent protein translocase protein TatA